MFGFNGNRKTTGLWIGTEDGTDSNIDAIGFYSDDKGNSTEFRAAIKGGTEAVIKQNQPGRPIHWHLQRPDGTHHPAAADPELRRRIIDELRMLSDNE